MILIGDTIEQMATLDDESVQCCVTSPPYWGLRDYGVDGQIGLEPTPQEYITNMVKVFAEVRRVLRDDGTLWLNIADSYASDYKGSGGPSAKQDTNAGSRYSPHKLRHGVKPKDLCLIPERIALALQDDGWWVRSRIAWCKKSSMPESVTDRPTSAWEHIWLLTKSARYYYDAEAVKQKAATPPHAPGNKKVDASRNDKDEMGRTWGAPKQDGHGPRHEGFNGRSEVAPAPAMSNLRNFWLLGPEPFTAAHFAVFPTEIPRRCIKAGSKPRDLILDPFLGSGTTAAVAQELDRRWVGCELNPEYAALAEQRIASVGAPQIQLTI